MNTMISHPNMAATTITEPRNDDGLALPTGLWLGPSGYEYG